MAGVCCKIVAGGSLRCVLRLGMLQPRNAGAVRLLFRSLPVERLVKRRRTVVFVVWKGKLTRAARDRGGRGSLKSREDLRSGDDDGVGATALEDPSVPLPSLRRRLLLPRITDNNTPT